MNKYLKKEEMKKRRMQQLQRLDEEKELRMEKARARQMEMWRAKEEKKEVERARRNSEGGSREVMREEEWRNTPAVQIRRTYQHKLDNLEQKMREL